MTNQPGSVGAHVTSLIDAAEAKRLDPSDVQVAAAARLRQAARELDMALAGRLPSLPNYQALFDSAFARWESIWSQNV